MIDFGGIYARFGFAGHARADLVFSILWLGYTYRFRIKKAIGLMVGVFAWHELLVYVIFIIYWKQFPAFGIAWVAPLLFIFVISFFIMYRKSFQITKYWGITIGIFVLWIMLWFATGFQQSTQMFTNIPITGSLNANIFEFGYNITFSAMYWSIFQLK